MSDGIFLTTLNKWRSNPHVRSVSFEDGLIAEGHGGGDDSALARPNRKLSGV